MPRSPIDLREWNRGLPDFAEENAALRRDVIALTILALGFILGVLFMCI